MLSSISTCDRISGTWVAFAATIVAACRTPHPVATAQTEAAVRAAETAERDRRHDVARARFQSAIASARDPQSIGFARARFGETLLTWGEYREGTAQLEASVAAYPNDPAPWHNLGLGRVQMGDLEGAADAFENARDLAPTDWRPRISLAELRWRLATTCFRTAQHGDCAALVETTRHEYRALLALSIPHSLRRAVKWALTQLELPFAGLRPDVVSAPPP